LFLIFQTFCGTPNYAAVELISGIPYNGVKSDIWAMGVVLYVMMTGKPPFSGENISALYSKIKAVDYKCPEYFSRGKLQKYNFMDSLLTSAYSFVFVDLKTLLAKMLRKDPKARIDMDALRTDPWVNYEEIEKPIRMMPKVTGNPTPAQISQFIASITSDSSCIVYTIRQHMRDGASVSGASPDKNKTLQKTTTARRKSISVSAAAEQGVLFGSKRPTLQLMPGANNGQNGNNGETDVDDHLSPLPTKSPTGGLTLTSLPRPQHRRRLSMQDNIRPSGAPNSGSGHHEHSSSLFAGLGLISSNINSNSTHNTNSSGSNGNFAASPAMSPEPIARNAMRPRRNTIQLAFSPAFTKFASMAVGGMAHSATGGGGGSNASTNASADGGDSSTHNTGHKTAESSTSGSVGTGPDNSSQTVYNNQTSSRANGVHQAPAAVAAGVGGVGFGMRARRASVSTTTGNDRETSLMRRMSMVSPVDLGPLGAPTLQFKNGAVVSPNGQFMGVMSPTSGSIGGGSDIKLNSSKSPSINMSVDEEDENAEEESPLKINPSKKEIEEWHLMHRPPKEIRSARYSFNPQTTSSLSPSAIFQEVHRVLLLLRKHYDDKLAFERLDDYYQLNCKLKQGNTDDDVEFEIEVCKIWLLKLHGVRIKRLGGSAFVFKDVYSKIVENLNI
jgi:serine/threonine protein kinase